MNKKKVPPKYKKPFTSSYYGLKQSDISSHLFEREPAPEYIEEWTETLKQKSSFEAVKHAQSVLIFRLSQEWLALPTKIVKEVTQRRAIHRIPHRSNNILLGLVNLNGELQLYVALHQLLEIESIKLSASRLPYQQNRIVAIVKERALWVFPVDEIDGIYSWDLSALENVPVNVSKSRANYIKGLLNMDNRSIGLLDEELLFASLQRSLQ